MRFSFNQMRLKIFLGSNCLALLSAFSLRAYYWCKHFSRRSDPQSKLPVSNATTQPTCIISLDPLDVLNPRLLAETAEEFDVGAFIQAEIKRGAKDINVTKGGVIKSKINVPGGTTINFSKSQIKSIGVDTVFVVSKGNHDVKITGLNIDADGKRVIWVTGCNNFTLIDCTIQNTSSGGSRR